MNTPFALVLIVAGIVLLLVGVGSVHSIQSSFSQLFAGQLNDHMMWLVVGGSVCLVAGIFGCYRSRRA